MKNELMKRRGGWAELVSDKKGSAQTKAISEKVAKIPLTPNISKFILKKIANVILNSMEVVSSPNLTVCTK